MAFQMAGNQGPKVPPPYQRYPLGMHKGEWPNILSVTVHDEAEEQAFTASGYSIVAPTIPFDPEPKMPQTIEERLLALEEKVFRKGKK